jgi:hypothetical protein
MSLITFRDKNSKGDPVGPIWYLEFDALSGEEYSRDAEIPKYPVETGAILSDHYQPQPRKINLQGTVTDTPSGAWTMQEGKQNAAAPPVMAERPLELSTKAQHDAIQRAQGRGIPRVGASGVLRPVNTGVLPSRRLIEGNIERARIYIPRFALTLQVVSGSSFTSSGVTRIAAFRSVLDGLIESRTAVDVIMQDGAEFKNMMIADARAPRVSGSGGSITFSIDLQEVVFATSAITKAVEKPADTKHQGKTNTGRKNPKPVQPGSVELSRFQKSVAPNILAASRGIY